MDGSIQPQNMAQDAPANSAPLPDLKADEAAVAAARASYEALVAAIKGDAEGVSTTLATVVQGKVEIEQHLAIARDSISAIKGDAEGVTATLAAAKQAKEELDQHLAEARGSASAIKSDAEAVTASHAVIEKRKKELDLHVAHATESVSKIGEELELARTSAAELSTLASGIHAATAQSAETAKQATAAIESAKQMASTASETVGRIEVIRDEAIKIQATIAEKNEHIEGGLKHVAKVRREMDAALERATKSSEAVERQHQASKTSVEAIAATQLNVQSTKEKVDVDAVHVGEAREAVEAHADVTKKLAEIAGKTETQVAEYEEQLKTLIEQSRTQQKQINELLGGATDAGLASAFDRRSKKFKRPEMVWQIVFGFSILGLIGVAASYALSDGTLSNPSDWQQVVRMLATRIPFAAPLVWLAVHAARQASLAKRLEEEYAFKAAISMSFDGYRRQMAEIGENLPPSSPLATLCNNTLREIAASPGRVYDGQRMDPNIATSLAEVLKPTVEAGFKTVSDKLPDLRHLSLADAGSAATNTPA